MRKMIAIISPSIWPIMLFDFFIAATVFFLSFMKETTVRIIAMIQKTIVNISILNLSAYCCFYIIVITYAKGVTNVTLQTGGAYEKTFAAYTVY
jgi:hypothetical protein